MPAEKAYPVSRKVGHAALLKTAPAYSFGGRYRASHDEGTPGPGTYGPGTFGNFSNKGSGFGSAPRLNHSQEVTPSPDAYDPSGSQGQVRHRTSKYTFGMKAAGKQRPEVTPGPGAYDPGVSKDKQRPANPPKTIATRLQPPNDAEKRPAPNAYSPDYKIKEPKGASLKFRHSTRNYADAVPGPGTYEADPASNKIIGPTLHSRLPVSHGEHIGPGPVYEPKIETLLPNKAAYSFPKAQSGYANEQVPGPGTYIQEPVIARPAGYSIMSSGRSQPAYTMQGKPWFARPAAHPGPSDYDPSTSQTRKSFPAVGFHGASTKDSRASYPAPNAYSVEDVHKKLHPNTPAITISSRYPEPYAGERRPGPASYNPRFSNEKDVHAASIKFRHQTNQDDPLHATPAPHDYSNKDFKSPYMNTGKLRNGKTFGIKHLAKDREPTPGAHYAVGCTTLGIAADKSVAPSKLANSTYLL